jgi:ribonuclease J
MKLTILRGANQIGGSCVEVATDHSRIIIDAGLPLEDWRDDHRTPAPAQAFPATDRRALGMPGLFQHGPRVDGILLSHAHADHSGLICQTDPSIKVYSSKGTSKMLKAGSIFASQTALEKNRWAELKTQIPVQIGDFKVTPFNVDHSAFDSMAFLIEADGKRLLYTGDFRMHGRKPGMAEALIAHPRVPQVDVMLLEGTHFSSKPQQKATHLTEQQLQQEIEGSLQQEPRGLVLASFSPQNVDRLVTFYKAAKRCNRTFVADIYMAYVLYVVHGQCRSIPNPELQAGIRVFYNAGFTRKRNWQAVVARFPHTQIELAEIYSNPQKFVMVFRPSMLTLDFKQPLPPNTSCLYSFWHGYLKRPEWSNCLKVLTDQGCAFSERHTSGHVFVEDCVEFVRQIQPKCIVPIHTQAPERFPALFKNVRLIKDGEEMEIDC